MIKTQRTITMHVIFLLMFISLHIEAKPYETLFKSIREKPRSSIRGINGVYVINLDIRPEKWHRLETILYYHGVDNTRFSAVCGMDFDLPIISNFCTRHLRPGALGVMLSHLSIYDDALKKDLKVIWIMEDDVVILRDPKLLTNFIQELNKIDPEWDILYTDLDFVKIDGTITRTLALPVDKKHPFSHSLEFYEYRENVSQNIQLIRSRYGMTSMIVSDRGMKKVLEHFTNYDDILWPIDIEIHFIDGLRQYGIIDPVVTNGYFPFSFSDASWLQEASTFYEINDNNVERIVERVIFVRKLTENWNNLFPLNSTGEL